MLFKLLSLKRSGAEQGAARHDEVLALYVILLGNQEVLLLCTNRGNHAMAVFAKELQNALSLFVNNAHRTEKRGFLVECFTGVGAKCSRDAQHFILDECKAGWIPCGVAASLERGTQTARGETRCIGLALNELLTAEGHDCGAVTYGVQEAVMLFRGDA